MLAAVTPAVVTAVVLDNKRCANPAEAVLEVTSSSDIASVIEAESGANRRGRVQVAATARRPQVVDRSPLGLLWPNIRAGFVEGLSGIPLSPPTNPETKNLLFGYW